MGAIEELSNKARNAAGILCMGNAECEELSGDLMRLADQVEAELAARGEERVIELTPLAGGRVHLHFVVPDRNAPGGYSLTNETARLIFGDVPDGTHPVAIRRLPDAPKPVAVWELPEASNRTAAHPHMCSHCAVYLRADARHCGKCGSPLASTASPWPGNQAKGEES